MRTASDFTPEKQEFEKILASGIFNRAPNLAQVLTYVCERYFEGAAEQIKEYNIAVEALGRPAGFDQKRDSIVRVEAHRLRKRLREYYESDGAGHKIHIDIPPGQYAPIFIHQEIPRPAMQEQSLVVPERLSIQPREAEVISAQECTEIGALAPIHDPTFDTPAQLLLERPYKSTSGLWIALALAVVVGSGLFMWKLSAAKTKGVSGAAIPGIAGQSPDIRILAGLQTGIYTDRFGRVWQSDRFYQGGSAFEATGKPIYGTREQRIFQSRREGTFSYDIPLSPGAYELRLYFAENLYGEGNMAGGGETSRIFAVFANSVELLRDFDVVREAGPSTADIRAFKDVSPGPDGKLHLTFQPTMNTAMVSAIEITPGTPGRMVPIRMASRDRPYTDKEGRIWEVDKYSQGGQLAMRNEPVSNIDDAELLQGERYGNLNYVIPVPAGRYGILMYFAEAWFGPAQFAGGGVGSRIFDILCNGVAVRRGFDIFKEAHGSDRAVILPIHGMEPDAQGKITIHLKPVRNYASLNAMEVIDESN